VKGLIFNLLDSMGRQSGCADEAWDLVMEFVASETAHEAQSDTCLSCFDQSDGLLDAPSDGMVHCLGSDVSGVSESLSEFPEMAVMTEADERLGDSIPALVDPDFVPRSVMASPEGFSNDLLSLLEQLLAEALTGDEEDAETEDHPLLAIAPSRRN
jgi:hypothetical protein